jgi:large subunit ribosomal protein L31
LFLNKITPILNLFILLGAMMKKNIHPKYQQVLFVDSATDTKFVCGSTIKTEGTEKFNGVEYPVCRVAVSSASHPFFTGSKQLVDAEGRVDKFKKRYAAKPAPKQEEDEPQEEPAPKKQAAKKAPAKKAAAKK